MEKKGYWRRHLDDGPIERTQIPSAGLLTAHERYDGLKQSCWIDLLFKLRISHAFGYCRLLHSNVEVRISLLGQ
jgi:hypothetical protein